MLTILEDKFVITYSNDVECENLHLYSCLCCFINKSGNLLWWCANHMAYCAYATSI